MNRALVRERVVHRYLTAAKPMAPEKLNALLIKIRKGATASITLKQWIDVLNQLGGWRIEDIVGLVQIHGHRDPNAPELEDGPVAHRHAVEFQWERRKKQEVQTLPTHPVDGQEYTMDVTDISTAGWRENMCGFTYRIWRGTKGIRFTSPEGKVFEVLPSKWDLERTSTPKLHPRELDGWLRKETKLGAQISNRLGMPTYEEERADKRAPRTRDGTGTCPACFRNIKIKMRSEPQLPDIVLHGYERPGWGEVLGRCFGVGYPPYELSPEGTKACVKHLEGKLNRARHELTHLTSDRCTELVLDDDARRPKIIKKGEPDWERHLKSKIGLQEAYVRSLERDIKTLQQLVDTWKLQELPREGDKAKLPPVGLR